MRKEPNTEKILELRDHAPYAAARDKLEQLESALAEAIRRVSGMEMRVGREDLPVQQYVGRNVTPVGQISELALDDIATKIITAGSISPKLMAEARSGAPKISLPSESDMETISEIQEARAASLLFGHAVMLQKREVSRQKDLAVTTICNSSQPERQRNVVEVLAALSQFALALRKEFAFVDRLRFQDDAIPNLLSPRPFPLHLASDSVVLKWIATALNISEAEARVWIENPQPTVLLHSQSQGASQ